MEVVFMSYGREIMIPFVEAKGRDARGYPTSGKQPIYFKDNRCIIDSSDKEKLERLRSHPGNLKNRGDSFWEVLPEELENMELGKGKAFASDAIDGVTEVDEEILEKLDKLPASIPPAKLNAVIEDAEMIYDRFKIRGVPKPDKNDNPLKLRSKVVLMLDIIKEKGIWNGDKKGEESS